MSDYGETLAHAAGEGFDDIEAWRAARHRARHLDDWFYDDTLPDEPMEADDE